MALKASSLNAPVCRNKDHVWCIAHAFKVGPGRGSWRVVISQRGSVPGLRGGRGCHFRHCLQNLGHTHTNFSSEVYMIFA